MRLIFLFKMLTGKILELSGDFSTENIFITNKAIYNLFLSG
jgi:hypothetical protein